jgi:hypothetical protein
VGGMVYDCVLRRCKQGEAVSWKALGPEAVEAAVMNG